MRSKEEIEKEIKELEGRIWFIKMGDTWTFHDSQLVTELEFKVKKLKEELRCLEEKDMSALSAEVNV